MFFLNKNVTVYLVNLPMDIIQLDSWGQAHFSSSFVGLGEMWASLWGEVLGGSTLIYSTVPVLLCPITEASRLSHPLVMHGCMYQCLKENKERTTVHFRLRALSGQHGGSSYPRTAKLTDRGTETGRKRPALNPFHEWGLANAATPNHHHIEAVGSGICRKGTRSFHCMMGLQIKNIFLRFVISGLTTP